MRNLFVTLLLVLSAACAPEPRAPDLAVITVIGTNDVHGELIPQGESGGITTFSGYVANVREARVDDGAVLLVDAGDMWQGTLESNLGEGLAIVEAYNAMGYAAAAIGNHEFDFGPLGPRSIPENGGDNPRGALQARAIGADFPLLASNLVDSATGEMVQWDNVHAATLVHRAGVPIGIVGVLTERTPATTIAANIVGLEFAPLAESIELNARQLRAAGATLVVVVAHAGSRCSDFDDPIDTSSCNMEGEIMRVAGALPAGLVDHIVAGHEHRGIAHEVNGIAVTAAYSNARAFSRVDFTIDRTTGTVVNRRIFPPHPITPGESYEGRPVVPAPDIAAIAEQARQAAAARKAETLGPLLETAIPHRERPESPLGNLMTDAVLQMHDADVSIHNVWGGIRAELPQGEVTYGDIYQMFPFDNRVAIIELSGADLRRVIAEQAHHRNRAAGFSGMRVFVSCDADRMTVRMLRPDGSEIADADRIRVVANDFLVLGGDGILAPVMPDDGFPMPSASPLVRDSLVDWFREKDQPMRAEDFFDPANPRWNLPGVIPDDCRLSAE